VQYFPNFTYTTSIVTEVVSHIDLKTPLGGYGGGSAAYSGSPAPSAYSASSAQPSYSTGYSNANASNNSYSMAPPSSNPNAGYYGGYNA